MLNKSIFWLFFIFLITSSSVEAQFKADSSVKAEQKIHKKIQRVYFYAKRIRVDGKSKDWKGIPHISDSGSKIKPAGLDLTDVAIAPMEKGLYLLIRTRSKIHKKTDGNFFFSIDLVGEEEFDFGVQIYRNKPSSCSIDIYTANTANKETKRVEARGIKTKIISKFFGGLYLISDSIKQYP